MQIKCVYLSPEKSQIALDYSQRNKLLAYYKQVKLGPYTPEKEVEPGYFDVIGTDRRYVGQLG